MKVIFFNLVSEHRTQPAQDDVRSRLPNRFIASLEKNNLTRPLINNHRHTGSSTHSEPAKQTNIPEHEMNEKAFPDKPVLRRVLHPRPGKYIEITYASVVSSAKRNINHDHFNIVKNKNKYIYGVACFNVI